MPNKKSNAASAVLNDRLYVIGGYSYEKWTNSVAFFTAAENRWTSIAPMIHNMSNPQAGVANGYLFVMSENSCETFEKYDPISDEWSIVSQFIITKFYLVFV